MSKLLHHMAHAERETTLVQTCAVAPLKSLFVWWVPSLSNGFWVFRGFGVLGGFGGFWGVLGGFGGFCGFSTHKEMGHLPRTTDQRRSCSGSWRPLAVGFSPGSINVFSLPLIHVGMGQHETTRGQQVLVHVSTCQGFIWGSYF